MSRARNAGPGVGDLHNTCGFVLLAALFGSACVIGDLGNADNPTPFLGARAPAEDMADWGSPLEIDNPGSNQISYQARAYSDVGPLEISACPGNDPTRASLAILYLGAGGEWPVDNELTDLAHIGHTLRTYFRRLCVRLVVVGGVTNYLVNAPTNAEAAYATAPYDLARARLLAAATNVRVGINKILTVQYPSAPRYFYIGGSFSATVGAKMIDGPDEPGGAPYRDRLARAIMAGPPGGNVVEVCNHSLPGSHAWGAVNALTQQYCDTIKLGNANDGELYSASGGIRSFVQGGRFNTWVGTNDEVFGYNPSDPNIPSAVWHGVDGVANFGKSAGLSCSYDDCGDGPAPGDGHVTFRLLDGAAHSNVWTYADVPLDICQKLAYDLFGSKSSAEREAMCRG